MTAGVVVEGARVGSIWRRAARRVAVHRREALAVSAVWAPATVLAGLLNLYPRLAGIIAHHRGWSVAGALVIGMATLWVPIAVIDARRCTRETNLRVRVEADLALETAARRQRAAEDDLITERITEVLEQGTLQIVYQPVVEMADGRIVGYEALSRFPDGAGPDRWFQLAGRVDLGMELELAAIHEAIKGLEWLPEDVYLSVNASPAVLSEPGMVEALCKSWASRIVLELTEHTCIDDYSAFADARNRMAACGARLAVDDAGAGYASLSHIINLGPNAIKLDRTLVSRIGRDLARRSLVKVLVEFAADIGSVLIAEGVEDAEEALELRHLGVQYGQGWFYSPPMPIEGLKAAHLLQPSAVAPGGEGATGPLVF